MHLQGRAYTSEIIRAWTFSQAVVMGTHTAHTHLKNCVFLWRKIVHEVLWLHPRCVLQKNRMCCHCAAQLASLLQALWEPGQWCGQRWTQECHKHSQGRVTVMISEACTHKHPCIHTHMEERKEKKKKTCNKRNLFAARLWWGLSVWTGN